MSFITFIYRINNDPKIYYGKYVTDYISQDHEGFDLIVKNNLIDGLTAYRIKNKLSDVEYNDSNIKVGVMSCTYDNYIPSYSSNDEIFCFDFYEIKLNYNTKTYINGELIE